MIRTAVPRSPGRHLRNVPDGEKQETTPLELFFDLVFVFAVTQLSHLLLDHLTWEGAAQTLFLLLVVWWAWTYTTWWTNWFDPESSIPVRLVLVGGMLVDYSAPALRYWTRWFGKARADDWTINPRHFSERFQLFIIIALGESIVVSGATASGLDLDDETIVALSVAFAGTAALWWLYFDFVAKIATHRLTVSDNPGNMARDGYTYLHLPIVAGIIVAAVGDELVIAHPAHHLGGVEALVVVAGPALYLVGHVFFRLRMAGSLSQRRLLAALIILLLWFVHGAVRALVLSALVVVVLLVVIAIDARSSNEAAALRRRLDADRQAHEAEGVGSRT